MASRFLKGFLAALVISLLGDYLWHVVLMADFYNPRMEAITGVPMSADFPPFIFLFTVIASFVTTYFVLGAACKGTIGEGALHGGMMGLAMAAAINFVCHSLIPKWDLTLVGVDVAWGVVMTAIVGAAVIAVAGKKEGRAGRLMGV